MPTSQLSPEERAIRRTRVSPYQARIERTLTQWYADVPAVGQAGREWHLTAVAHTQGHATCQLCGHNPIRRLYFIKNQTNGQELMIGSECARNYVHVDLIAAYERQMVRAQNERRAARQREERRAYRQAEQSQMTNRFIEQNADVVAFLAAIPARLAENSFLLSVAEQLTARRHLSDRQVAAVRRFMERENTPQPRLRERPVASPPAEANECPSVFNGVYTMESGGQHLSFKIHTATQGPLRGKRIVKRLVAGGQFVGFGFLNRDGGLNLWRRYEADAEATYVRWARDLLAILTQSGTLTHVQSGRSAFTATLSQGSYRISLATVCRCCNRALTTPTSVERGIGPECEARATGENRTTAAPSGSVAPRPTYTPGTIAPRRNVASAPPVPRVGFVNQIALELSECGSGEVR